MYFINILVIKKFMKFTLIMSEVEILKGSELPIELCSMISAKENKKHLSMSHSFDE